MTDLRRTALGWVKFSKILLVGDSNSVDAPHSYTRPLGKMLWNAGWGFKNASEAGLTTHGGLQKILQNQDAKDCDLVVFPLGINDRFHGIEPYDLNQHGLWIEPDEMFKGVTKWKDKWHPEPVEHGTILENVWKAILHRGPVRAISAESPASP